MKTWASRKWGEFSFGGRFQISLCDRKNWSSCSWRNENQQDGKAKDKQEGNTQIWVRDWDCFREMLIDTLSFHQIIHLLPLHLFDCYLTATRQLDQLMVCQRRCVDVQESVKISFKICTKIIYMCVFSFILTVVSLSCSSIVAVLHQTCCSIIYQ